MGREGDRTEESAICIWYVCIEVVTKSAEENAVWRKSEELLIGTSVSAGANVLAGDCIPIVRAVPFIRDGLLRHIDIQ